MYKLIILVIVLLLLSFQAFAASDVIVTSLDYADGKFTSTLKNQGNTATPKTYISVSFLIDTAQHSYGKTLSSIAPGATLTLTSTTAKPLANGSYVVTAFADNLNRIAESNEANNKLTRIITVATPSDTSTIQGFAAAYGVTGGAGGQNIIVTNCKGDTSAGSLKAAIAVNTARTITFKPGMSCTITWPAASGVTYVNSGNMTLDGKGANITISGMSLSIHTGKGVPTNNVILRNLTFANTTATRNAVLVDYGSSGVWIDHNTFYNNSTGGIGQPLNINHQGTSYDGLAPKGITISWNYFRAPNIKAILVQSNNDKISTPMRVSIHHNRVDGIDARMPRIHGKDIVVHAWNNYLYAWKEYAMAANNSSNLWAENNYFENTSSVFKSALSYNYGAPSSGPNATYWYAASVKASGNYLGGTPTPTISTIGTFPMSEITYSVTPEAANGDLKTAIVRSAGANRAGL